MKPWDSLMSPIGIVRRYDPAKTEKANAGQPEDRDCPFHRLSVRIEAALGIPACLSHLCYKGAEMRHSRLGNSGLGISKLAFGAMTMGRSEERRVGKEGGSQGGSW